MSGVPRNKTGGGNSAAVMAQRHPSRAVVEARAPGVVETDDARRARWRALDFFGSPPWACRAGAEIIRAIDPDGMHAWEPACGDGVMARSILPYFSSVYSSDIEPQGFGETFDFLLPTTNGGFVDWVITNPPFKHAAEFVRLGMERARRGVAVLCRLAFLESSDRYALHFGGAPGLALLAPFCERVPMQLGPWDPGCSSATAYAWFIYRHGHQGAPTIRAIPPGTAPRLTLPDDIRRFVKPTETPLLASTERITA